MVQMTMNDKAGFKKLLTWKTAKELRSKTYKLAQKFPQSEYRRVSQMNDAIRSVKQNIQEGSQKSLGQYIYFLENISLASLSEYHGDLEDCLEDGLITQNEFNELDSLSRQLGYLLRRQIKSLKKLKIQKD
jgi:four helix bundle protein